MNSCFILLHLKYSKYKLENEIFVLVLLNRTVRKSKNSNIDTVNTIQKKFVNLHEMGEEIKSSFLIKMLLRQVCSYFSFHLPAVQIFISTWEKSYEDVCHSLLHVSVITRNILITIIRFTCYYLLLASHFHDWFYVLRYISDLSKLEWTLLLINFNYICDLANRRKLFPIPVAQYAFFSHQV